MNLDNVAARQPGRPEPPMVALTTAERDALVRVARAAQVWRHLNAAGDDGVNKASDEIDAAFDALEQA